MSALTSSVKAMVFDTFGSVVDWRASIVRDLSGWGAENGCTANWAELADKWRGKYQPRMQEVRSGKRAWTILDVLHRESLDELLPEFGLEHLTTTQRDHINRVWHRLDAWPDAVAGLSRLKSRYILGPLSNGNVALLTDIAKYSALPWDVILSTELFRCYKPQPQSYLGVCNILGLAPGEVMMCAAHNDDLRAARAVGLKTAFWPRPQEYGPTQTTNLVATEQWDVIAKDIRDLARQMGV